MLSKNRPIIYTMTLFDMNIIWRRLAVAAVAMVAGTMMSFSMAREAMVDGS